MLSLYFKLLFGPQLKVSDPVLYSEIEKMVSDISGSCDCNSDCYSDCCSYNINQSWVVLFEQEHKLSNLHALAAAQRIKEKLDGSASSVHAWVVILSCIETPVSPGFLQGHDHTQVGMQGAHARNTAMHHAGDAEQHSAMLWRSCSKAENGIFVDPAADADFSEHCSCTLTQGDHPLLEVTSIPIFQKPEPCLLQKSVADAVIEGQLGKAIEKCRARQEAVTYLHICGAGSSTFGQIEKILVSMHESHMALLQFSGNEASAACILARGLESLLAPIQVFLGQSHMDFGQCIANEQYMGTGQDTAQGPCALTHHQRRDLLDFCACMQYLSCASFNATLSAGFFMRAAMASLFALAFYLENSNKLDTTLLIILGAADSIPPAARRFIHNLILRISQQCKVLVVFLGPKGRFPLHGNSNTRLTIRRQRKKPIKALQSRADIDCSQGNSRESKQIFTDARSRFCVPSHVNERAHVTEPSQVTECAQSIDAQCQGPNPQCMQLLISWDRSKERCAFIYASLLSMNLVSLQQRADFLQVLGYVPLMCQGINQGLDCFDAASLGKLPLRNRASLAELAGSNLGSIKSIIDQEFLVFCRKLVNERHILSSQGFIEFFAILQGSEKMKRAQSQDDPQGFLDDSVFLQSIAHESAYSPTNPELPGNAQSSALASFPEVASTTPPRHSSEALRPSALSSSDEFPHWITAFNHNYGLHNLDACTSLLADAMAAAHNKKEVAAVQLYSSIVSYSRRQLHSASQSAKNALIALQDSNLAELSVKALFILGLCSLGQEQLIEGSEYLNNAASEARDAGLNTELFAITVCEIAAALVYGQFSRAILRTESLLEIGRGEFRYDWECVGYFLQGRIAFELGRYEEAMKKFGAVRSCARIIKHKNAGDRAFVWYARCATHFGNLELASRVLGMFPHDAEALWFLAEVRAIEMEYSSARALCEQALHVCPSAESAWIDSFQWSDGFSSLESLSTGFSTGRSYLVDQIKAFCEYVSGLEHSGEPDESYVHANELAAQAREKKLCQFNPSLHLYIFYRYIILNIIKKHSSETATTLSRAFRAFQDRASRTEDARLSEDFMSRNIWNRAIISAAREHKLL